MKQLNTTKTNFLPPWAGPSDAVNDPVAMPESEEQGAATAAATSADITAEVATNHPQQPVTITTADNVRLFGLDVTNSTMQEAVSWIVERAWNKQKSVVNFVNAHCLNIASKDDHYYRVLANSDRILPDGSGVQLAMRFQGKRLKENLNGTDLFPQLCEQAEKRGLSLYLLGAGPGIAESVAQKMRARFPKLKIAGTRDGFFEAEETPEVIASINRSGADILLVAMGVPMQENWINEHLDALNTSVNMGVGGLFDFYSERISRAPSWLRGLGLEWTWRLLQEPARMWRRYILGNPEFVMRALRDASQEKREMAPPSALNKGKRKAQSRRLKRWFSGRLMAGAKRALDILVSGTALLVASPFLLLTIIAIRLESPGPIFFSQQRVGLYGVPFKLWKFRSMYIDAEERKAALMAQNQMEGGVLFKMKNDPRITYVGRFIRRFSIDELPQLWNVLRGDMALVGPRPALPSEVAQYSLTDRYRLLSRPGITCIWQVSGRSTIPFDQQVQMDVEYIHKATLGKDIELLVKTVPAVITGRGAY